MPAKSSRADNSRELAEAGLAIRDLNRRGLKGCVSYVAARPLRASWGSVGLQNGCSVRGRVGLMAGRGARGRWGRVVAAREQARLALGVGADAPDPYAAPPVARATSQVVLSAERVPHSAGVVVLSVGE